MYSYSRKDPCTCIRMNLPLHDSLMLLHKIFQLAIRLQGHTYVVLYQHGWLLTESVIEHIGLSLREAGQWVWPEMLLYSIYRYINVFSGILFGIGSSFPLHIKKFQRWAGGRCRRAAEDVEVAKHAIRLCEISSARRSRHISEHQQHEPGHHWLCPKKQPYGHEAAPEFSFEGTLIFWRRPDANMWK